MFLEELLKEVRDVREISDPAGAEEPKEGDTVVGELDADLKALHTIVVRKDSLMMKIKRELMKKAIDGEPATDKQMEKYVLATLHFETARSIFWTSVKTQFPELASKSQVLLCKGWKVAWQKESDVEVIGIPLSALFGMGRGG